MPSDSAQASDAILMRSRRNGLRGGAWGLEMVGRERVLKFKGRVELGSLSVCES